MRTLVSLTIALSLTPLLGTKEARAERSEAIRHVLLLSVDGLHALDVARFVSEHPGSALAELSRHGTTYTNARTPAHTDSFPGLLALVTGGSPVSHGVFYDVSYERTFFDPANTTCAGAPGSPMVLDESLDVYSAARVSLDVIDPAKLPRRLDRRRGCVPAFPHDIVRVNNVFEVVRAAGRHTAWADKHPAYDLVNGPSGSGVEDLYTPEITNVDGFDATGSVVCTAENDAKKVAAILNQIRGLRHDGAAGPGTPALFGMNFQAVSVGQKLAKDNADMGCASDLDPHLNQQPGGYKDGAGAPSDVLAYGLAKTDEAIGRIIQALERERIYESTLIVLTAKHGQSPINPVKVNKPGHFADLVAGLPDAGTNPAALALASAAACGSGSCGFVQDDDVALIWLPQQSQTAAVAAYLNANARALFIDEVLAGEVLKLRFNDPLADSRTPDIMVQPAYGTIYTASGKKNAEHGGFNFADTNVALVVSNPGLRAQIIKTPVATSQVAPTVLEALGLEPGALGAVRIEHTRSLPRPTGEGDHRY
jgi:hypothetical protein